VKREVKEETVYDYMKKVAPGKFPQDVMYHYTSFRTFPVFFEKNADLFCTHFSALNDGHEIREGWVAAIKFLEAEYGWSKEKCDLLWSYYKHGVLEGKFGTVWVMSFSRSRDSLNQWIAYTDREEGGYALGFDVPYLEGMLNRARCNAKKVRVSEDQKEYPCRMYILPCLYTNSDRDVIDELFRTYFGQAKDVFDAVKNSENPVSADLAKVIAKIQVVAATIKHESFRYEEEVRLVVQQTAQDFAKCEFIAGKPRWKTQIGVYMNSSLCTLFKEIVISPHGDKQVLRTSANVMKAKHSLSCTITESTSPFNGR